MLTFNKVKNASFYFFPFSLFFLLLGLALGTVRHEQSYASANADTRHIDDASDTIAIENHGVFIGMERVIAVGCHHIDAEAEQESAANAKQQPADAEGGVLVSAAVEADAFEIDVSEFGNFADEQQSLLSVNKKFHDFVDAAKHDGAVQGNHNPFHSLDV